MSHAVASQNDTSSLSGLLLPLADRTLLLPNVAVAELIAYQTPQEIAHAPDWLLGRIIWRDLSLPLVSFERSEEHTSELQSRENLVCRLLLEKKNITGRD